MMLRSCAFATLLVLAAAGCGGGKTETTTTTNAQPAGGGARGASKSAGGESSGGAIRGYATESEAQAHCRGDAVVWLNMKTNVYHAKGSTFYGHTKSGEYVCRRDADAAGDRASKNGS